MSEKLDKQLYLTTDVFSGNYACCSPVSLHALPLLLFALVFGLFGHVFHLQHIKYPRSATDATRA